MFESTVASISVVSSGVAVDVSAPAADTIDNQRVS